MIEDDILNKLLAAFDTQIDDEKGHRDTAPKPDIDYYKGRVDGAESGRYLVERVFSEYQKQNLHLVPFVPTKKMIIAAAGDDYGKEDQELVTKEWQAMIKVAGNK